MLDNGIEIWYINFLLKKNAFLCLHMIGQVYFQGWFFIKSFCIDFTHQKIAVICRIWEAMLISELFSDGSYMLETYRYSSP